MLFHGDYGQQHQIHALIVESVKSGKISQERLNDAVRRILTVKKRFGIGQLGNKIIQKRNARISSARSLSRRTAAESITVVRDNAHLLPFSSKDKLLVIETSPALGLGKALGVGAIQVSQQPKPEDIYKVARLAPSYHKIIVATSDVSNN